MGCVPDNGRALCPAFRLRCVLSAVSSVPVNLRALALDVCISWTKSVDKSSSSRLCENIRPNSAVHTLSLHGPGFRRRWLARRPARVRARGPSGQSILHARPRTTRVEAVIIEDTSVSGACGGRINCRGQTAPAMPNEGLNASALPRIRSPRPYPEPCPAPNHLRMQPSSPAPLHFFGTRVRAIWSTVILSWFIRTTTTSMGLSTCFFTTGTMLSDTPL